LTPITAETSAAKLPNNKRDFGMGTNKSTHQIEAEKLQADIDAYLKNGGTVTVCSSSDYQREKKLTKSESRAAYKQRIHAQQYRSGYALSVAGESEK
jgi:hypothetical protein